MFRKSIVKIVICCSCLFVAHAAVAKDKNITIGLIGDSTVADTYGWGPAFAAKGNGQVTVLNYAADGATLDSLSNKLDALIALKPNYVLIQFGHNDMHYYDKIAYGEKLKGYVERVTLSGSIPIVLSPVSRRNFAGNGKISPRIVNGNRSLPIFAQTAQAIAKEARTPFIDLNSISMEHHNKIGPEASAAYNFGGTDITHFSKKGAEAIADLVVNSLKAVAPELTPYLK